MWEHLKRSIAFVYENIGSHGLPLMLHSDWNDMLYKVCREGKGESVMVAFMLGIALRQMEELAGLLGEENDYAARYEAMRETVNRVAWDGRWYARATMDDGRFLGTEKEPQAKNLAQRADMGRAFRHGAAAASGAGHGQCKAIFGHAARHQKIHPAMADYPTAEDPLTYYNKGCGENGSVFCHANAWAVIAECMLGRGANAWKYYSQLLPMNAQAKAGEWRYKAEPYVYSSNIFGPESDKFGLANVSWLTGTSAWMYVAFTQHILGVRARWDGLELCPCLPPEWGKRTGHARFPRLPISAYAEKWGKVIYSAYGRTKRICTKRSCLSRSMNCRRGRCIWIFTPRGSSKAWARSSAKKISSRRCGRKCIQHHGVRQMSPWILLLSDKNRHDAPAARFRFVGRNAGCRA